MKVVNYKNEYSQKEQLDRWSELIAFYRFYPDLWLDLITPTEMDEETLELEKEHYFFTPIKEIIESENHVYDLALDILTLL